MIETPNSKGLKIVISLTYMCKLVYRLCFMKCLRAQFVLRYAWPEIAHYLLCFPMLRRERGGGHISLSKGRTLKLPYNSSSHRIR